MKIKGIAFDMEGTVINVEPAHHQAHILVGKELGVNLTIEEAVALIPGFIGGGDPVVMLGFKDLSGSAISVEELVAKKMVHYERILASMKIEPRPGLMEFLVEVHKLGLPIAIGSLTPKAQADVLLDHSGLGEIFGRDRIVLREDVANIKPAPDVFLRTAQIMDIQPEQQLVFEDSPTGIKAAVAAGSRAIGMPVYPPRLTAAKLAEAGACRIFWDWREINIRALINNLNAE